MPRPRLTPLLLLTLTPLLRAADTEPTTPQPIPNSPEITLQRTLDQPFTLALPKAELSEAFKQIAATAKISLQVDPACYELLPYGNTTRVSADFRQSKLRDALEEILIPLGLQQSVSGATVVIRPSNPLARIGRRAEWEELKLMQELRTSPDVKPPVPPAVLTLTDAIRSALDGRKDLVVAINPDLGTAHDRALEQIRKQLPLSAYRVLELYCQLTNQIWFVEAGALAGGPTGGTIRIMSPRQWIEHRQLDRPIQIARTNEPLEVVVADLTHASGIRFVPEPGLYRAVPVVSLLSNNGTVRQTLEALTGSTPIAFDVRDDSILLHLSPGAGAAAPKSDAIIGRISVPVGKDGTMMDIFLHESDLSPDLNDLRKKRLQEALEGLQKIWTTPAVLPIDPATLTTQPSPPATVPAK